MTDLPWVMFLRICSGEGHASRAPFARFHARVLAVMGLGCQDSVAARIGGAVYPQLQREREGVRCCQWELTADEVYY